MFGDLNKKPYLCTRNQNKNGSVAQLNRASDYGSEGYRFESCRSHKTVCKFIKFANRFSYPPLNTISP
jgi:hypothetical protein